MTTRLTPGARYSAVAIALHWLIAALILANYFLAWTAEDAPEAVERQLMGSHMAFGILILLLSVLRVVWRLINPAPPLEPGLKAWEVALAKVTHALLYFLMIAVPFAGWAMVSAFSGQGVDIFGILDVPALPFAKSEATADVFHEVHEIFATAMLALSALHIAAALKHQFVDKDATMARMSPLRRRL